MKLTFQVWNWFLGYCNTQDGKVQHFRELGCVFYILRYCSIGLKNFKKPQTKKKENQFLPDQNKWGLQYLPFWSGLALWRIVFSKCWSAIEMARLKRSITGWFLRRAGGAVCTLVEGRLPSSECKRWGHKISWNEIQDYSMFTNLWVGGIGRAHLFLWNKVGIWKLPWEIFLLYLG